MITTTAVKAIIYLRLSDLKDGDLDENGEIKTFPARERSLRELAARLGWEVVAVVQENDVAEKKNGKRRGVSAFKRKKITLPDGTVTFRVIRPGFQSIVKDMWAGVANGLLAEDLDRVFRDPRDLEDFIEVAEYKKVNAESLSGSLKFTNGGTDLEISAARGAVNHANLSSRDARRRVKAGRRRKAYTGEFGGGKRPYGFNADGLTPLWDEYLVLAECSRRVLQGASLRSLALDLREAEVPTVTGVPWSAETLRCVLLRPRNAGIQVYDGKEIGVASWRPAVSVDVFRAVVRKLTDPNRKTNGGAAPKYVGTGQFLCGVCDDGTSVDVTLGGREARYKCREKAHMTRNRAKVYDLVLGAVAARLSQPDAVAMFQRPTTPAVDVAGLRSEADAVAANLKGLAEDRAMGLIDRAEHLAGAEKGRARLAEIERVLAAAAAVSPVAEVIGAKDVRAALEAAPLSLRRLIVAEVAEVTILPTGRSGNVFRPEFVHIELEPTKWRRNRVDVAVAS